MEIISFIVKFIYIYIRGIILIYFLQLICLSYCYIFVDILISFNIWQGKFYDHYHLILFF